MVQTKIIPRYPALMIEGAKKSLVITDLHLGFESNLSLNNVFLGKNKTVSEITKEIEKIIKKTKPDSLVLLGDIKSGIKSITKTEWETVPIFFESITKLIDTILVPGNRGFPSEGGRSDWAHHRTRGLTGGGGSAQCPPRGPASALPGPPGGSGSNQWPGRLADRAAFLLR